MKHLLFFLFLFSLFFSAQNQLAKQWDKAYGGYGNEFYPILISTNDGGYLMAGGTESDSGADVTQPSRGMLDGWVIKTDSLGNKQWEKRFGGSNFDFIGSLQQTSDGGYIFGANTQSDSSGDVSQPMHGDEDYWLIKTDQWGNKLWDKRFGGDRYELLKEVRQTSDKGYILAGCTLSGISGDVSEPGQGTLDYWLVKTDSVGIKQWDKRFGGIGAEYLFSMELTNDGGYILAGATSSDSGYDITQPTQGSEDYWLVKTDSLGNKQWDKRFGGNNRDQCFSVQQTNDEGYILAGLSDSDSSGDVSEPGRGLEDYWLVKTDSAGNKQWDKRFGGAKAEEDFGCVRQTPDRGYIVSGTTYSDTISGDKTENNLGQEQTWLVKIDSQGHKEWDKTIFTSGHDESARALPVNSGCYTIAISTNAGIGGYKTEPGYFTFDFWLIKFCPLVCNLTPVLITANDTITCANDSVYICNTNNALNGVWNTGATANCIYTSLAGSYYFTITDSNNCSAESNHIYVFAYPYSPVSISVNGDTLKAYNAVTYQWYLNDSIISGANSNVYIANLGGSYSVAVTDSNGCSATSNPIVLTGINKLNSSFVSISPNPFSSSISVSLQTQNLQQANATITDVTGRLVFKSAIQNPQFEINTGNWSAGVYFLQITADGERSVRQLLKQ